MDYPQPRLEDKCQLGCTQVMPYAPPETRAPEFDIPERADDAHWSLAMALAWITSRNRQAVVDIKHGKWAPSREAFRYLLSALRSGKLVAHGISPDGSIAHPIDTGVWASFKIKGKRRIFPGHGTLAGIPIVIAQRIGRPDIRLLHVTVPAAKVRKMWPAAKRTAAAETRCREYLTSEMKQSFDQAPKPKRDFRAYCLERFPGLSERAFARAWKCAIEQTGAANWRKAGRPRSSSR